MITRSSTRCGFLAVVGASALAGCNGLGNSGGEAETTVSTCYLATDSGESDSVVAESIPVDIEQSLLDERLQRVHELLERVPTPLDHDRIPKGVIRERLLDVTDEAAIRPTRSVGTDPILGPAGDVPT